MKLFWIPLPCEVSHSATLPSSVPLWRGSWRLFTVIPATSGKACSLHVGLLSSLCLFSFFFFSAGPSTPSSHIIPVSTFPWVCLKHKAVCVHCYRIMEARAGLYRAATKFLFLGHTCGIWQFQGRGQIGAAAASLHHSHSNTRSELRLLSVPQLSNTRSLTHWGEPGIKPMSSWILVCFATAEPQQELWRGKLLMEEKWQTISIADFWGEWWHEHLRGETATAEECRQHICYNRRESRVYKYWYL